MNVDVGYNICLPPEYNRDPKARFPVIYYLHGYDGSESSFLEYAKHWRESLSHSGPSILVFVNGGATSFFSDSPDGSVMGETVVVKELVPHIDRSFRTITNASGRSLHGYSMGGFGALKLAFKHPGLFRSVVAYGATLSDAEQMKRHLGKVYTKMFGADKTRFQENNPLFLIDRNGAAIRDRVAAQLIIGSKDEFLPANRHLAERLAASHIPHTFEEVPGAGHKKEALYDKVAARGFAFSARYFPKR